MISRIAGFFILIASLAVVYLFESSAASEGVFRIFHWPAMVLTIVGPIGLVLLCTPTHVFGKLGTILFGSSPREINRQAEKQSMILHRISENFYTKGRGAFHGLAVQDLNPLVQKVIERLSMRMPPQDVRDLLVRDREVLEAQFEQVSNVPSLGVRLAPSLGMLGTILGMTQLLSHLKDPSSLGTHMGLALLTTFYGLFCSLVVWTPIEHYLDHILSSHQRCLDQAEHWLELLERRKPAEYFIDEMDEKQIHV